jgi:HEAT repeat protein
MSLFGPNIKKMKNRGDVKGLIDALRDANPKVRTEAIAALIELRSVEGLKN